MDVPSSRSKPVWRWVGMRAFFFFKEKTAYGIRLGLGGSEIWIRVPLITVTPLPCGNVISSKAIQSLNALAPISITVLGIAIDVNFEQPSNALERIFSNMAVSSLAPSNVKDVKPFASFREDPSKRSNLLGKVSVVKAEVSLNANASTVIVLLSVPV